MTGDAARASDVSARLARFTHSATAGWLARVGLASRALIYGLLAGIVTRVAFGATSGIGSDVDQDSSLQVLGRSTSGRLLLWLFVGSVGCYCLWRLSEACLGTADPGGDALWPRLQAGIEGVAYLPFGWIAAAVATGDASSSRQGQNYRGLAASVIRDPLGRVAVAVTGIVVMIVGGFFLVQGVRRSFRGHFDWHVMPRWARRAVEISGAVGSIGRGLVFVLAGALVIVGAITVDPQKAGGVDSALDALKARSGGSWLLAGCAVGFAAFAVFAVCEAIWRRLGTADPLGARALHT